MPRHIPLPHDRAVACMHPNDLQEVPAYGASALFDSSTVVCRAVDVSRLEGTMMYEPICLRQYGLPLSCLELMAPYDIKSIKAPRPFCLGYLLLNMASPPLYLRSQRGTSPHPFRLKHLFPQPGSPLRCVSGLEGAHSLHRSCMGHLLLNIQQSPRDVCSRCWRGTCTWAMWGRWERRSWRRSRRSWARPRSRWRAAWFSRARRPAWKSA